MGKQRRDKIEFYDDVLYPAQASATPPAPTQLVQCHTEISSSNAFMSTIQTYYNVTGPPSIQTPLPKPVIEDIKWNTQPKGDDTKSGFDEPIDFIDPSSVITELDIMDDTRDQGNRHLGVHTTLLIALHIN